MTDWGDATPNETGRPPTWKQPPAEPVESLRARPLSAGERLAAGYGYALSTPLWRHDKGERVIPPPTTEGGS